MQEVEKDKLRCRMLLTGTSEYKGGHPKAFAVAASPQHSKVTLVTPHLHLESLQAWSEGESRPLHSGLRGHTMSMGISKPHQMVEVPSDQ